MSLSRSIASSTVSTFVGLLGGGGASYAYRLLADFASAAAFFDAAASSLTHASRIGRSTKRVQSFLKTSTILKIKTPPFGTCL